MQHNDSLHSLSPQRLDNDVEAPLEADYFERIQQPLEWVSDAPALETLEWEATCD